MPSDEEVLNRLFLSFLSKSEESLFIIFYSFFSYEFIELLQLLLGVSLRWRVDERLDWLLRESASEALLRWPPSKA